MQAQLTQDQPDQIGIELHDYIDILYRRRYLAFFMFIVTTVAVVVFTLRAPPQYQTSATLVVEESDVIQIPALALSEQGSRIRTLAEILKSRVVAERALKRAGLDPGDLGRVRGNVNVVEGVQGTSLITVTVTDTMPQRAARLANAMAEEFITLSLEVRKRQAVAARQFLQQQVVIADSDVRRAEEDLLRFQRVGTNIALRDEITRRVERIADLQAQKTMLAIERQLTTLRMQDAQRQLRQRPELSPLAYGTPLVLGLQEDLSKLEIELAVLREKYTDSHPQVVAGMARARELQRRLAEEAAKPLAPTGYAKDPYYAQFQNTIVQGQVDLIVSKAREDALEVLILQASRDLEGLPIKELTLARLERNLRQTEAKYLSLSTKLQDAQVIEASVVPDIRIVDTAQPPIDPVGPNVTRNILLGTMLGAILGVGLALGADYLDRSVRTPEEAERLTGLPILGSIPGIVVGRQDRSRDYEMRGGIIVASHPDRLSGLAEAFRGVRTALLFASPDRDVKTVLVTSAVPGEGKTTLAINLAMSFSATGRKVWLVEADLRLASKLTQLFPHTTQKGLTNYLVGAASLDQILNSAPDYGITYIQVGDVPPNPSELAGSEQMSKFLAMARSSTDLVILDSSPILAVTDSLLLATKVDGVILVAEAARTPRDLIKGMQQRLVGSGAHILGLVLSKVPISAGRYGGYGYGYGYGYGDGYSRGRDGNESARSDADGGTSERSPHRT